MKLKTIVFLRLIPLVINTKFSVKKSLNLASTKIVEDANLKRHDLSPYYFQQMQIFSKFFFLET